MNATRVPIREVLSHWVPRDEEIDLSSLCALIEVALPLDWDDLMDDGFGRAR